MLLTSYEVHVTRTVTGNKTAQDSRELKGVVSRNSANLGNYKMPVSLRETKKNNRFKH